MVPIERFELGKFNLIEKLFTVTLESESSLSKFPKTAFNIGNIPLLKLMYLRNYRFDIFHQGAQWNFYVIIGGVDSKTFNFDYIIGILVVRKFQKVILISIHPESIFPVLTVLMSSIEVSIEISNLVQEKIIK